MHIATVVVYDIQKRLSPAGPLSRGFSHRAWPGMARGRNGSRVARVAGARDRGLERPGGSWAGSDTRHQHWRSTTPLPAFQPNTGRHSTSNRFGASRPIAALHARRTVPAGLQAVKTDMFLFLDRLVRLDTVYDHTVRCSNKARSGGS